MLHPSIFSWLMFPVYVWQGIRLRRTIERLLPPRLPVDGTIDGKGAPIRLLVIGDSTVASVGVERLEETFGFAIAKAMHERTGRTVHWRSAGNNSASSGQLRDHVVPHLPHDAYTHVLLSAATNDMKNFHLMSRFKREFGTLLYALRTRFAHAHIVWTPIADMRKFPALAPQLGRVLAARASLINDMGTRLCRERGVTAAEPFPIVSVHGFARDGFHPDGDGYKAWARFLAPQLLALEPLTPEVRTHDSGTITPMTKTPSAKPDSTN